MLASVFFRSQVPAFPSLIRSHKSPDKKKGFDVVIVVVVVVAAAVVAVVAPFLQIFIHLKVGFFYSNFLPYYVSCSQVNTKSKDVKKGFARFRWNWKQGSDFNIKV